MNSSRSSIPETLQHSGEGLHSVVENNPVKSTLPPFKVLLQWLTFYHEQTGAWPAPEEYKENQNVTRPHLQQSEDKSHLKVLPGRPKKTITASPENKLNGFTNYDYKSSIYYHQAIELAAKHASAAPLLNEASILTLSSVLAWCNYPVFLTEFKDKVKDNDYEPGMYLPLNWWSRELKIRKATLGACLKELEAAGLIKIKISELKKGITVNRNRFYQLAVLPLNPLPVFNPAETTINLIPAAQSDDYRPQSHQEPLKRKAEPHLITVPSLGTAPVQSNSMYMFSQIQSNKFKNIKPVEHDHGSGHLVEPGTATVDEKVEFLSQKAIFPGYSSPDGLIALDSREALKFASNPVLDLFTIKRIYHQVLSAWSGGKCSKNPIGFFHHSLTQYLKKVKGSLNLAAHLETAVQSGPGNPSFNETAKNAGSRFHPTNTPIINKSRVGHSSAGDPPEKQITLDLLNQAEETAPQGTTQLDITKTQQDLKERVIEALQNRFRQPELAGKLGHLNWVVCCCQSDAGEALQIRLDSQQSDFLLASTFGQSDFSLLKIASSQILKSLGIDARNFEIWFEDTLL